MAEARRAQRADALATAYALHPERFVRGVPTPAAPPTAFLVNEPPSTSSALDVNRTAGDNQARG